MQITIERGHPLCAHRQSVHPQCLTRWTSTSEYLACHIQLWNKLKILVFVSSSRRSRTTLIDKIFKPIFNKIMPTTHLVKSKKMIKDMGNVELFELCETNPKTQCKECLSYWNQSIVHCTCGHLLKESEASRGAIQCTLDLLSIQNYVIKKGRPHGHRYGKTKEQKDHHIAHNLRKRCIKRNFEGIHDRFLKDPTYRESQPEHDRNEEVCIQMDKIAQKDFTYRMTQEEYFRYRKNWLISLNKSGKIGPVKDRSDFNDVLTTTNRPKIWRATTQASAILEIPAMAPIIEFVLQQLVAVERFLVEFMTIKKVHNWAHVQNDMIERKDPLFVPSFHKTSDVSIFKIFRFVAVRSFTADSSLLQPTVSVNTTTSHVHFRSVNLYKEFLYRLKVNKFGAWQRVNFYFGTQNDKPNNVWGNPKHLGICERSSDANRHEGIMALKLLLLSASLDCLPCSDDITLLWLKFESALIHMSSHLRGSCASCVSLIASTSPFSSTSSSSLWSPCSSFCLSTSSSRMWSSTLLCTSAEDLGTLAENEPPTGYEPNEYHITEAYVDYTQESSVQQRAPNDFDYDDVTIGQTLLHACQRRADHSEEEGLSSCLSSSVSHDRTVRPVVCSLGSLVSSVQETQRQKLRKWTD